VDHPSYAYHHHLCTEVATATAAAAAAAELAVAAKVHQIAAAGFQLSRRLPGKETVTTQALGCI